MGGTSFESVIREIIRIRKENPQITLEEYPSTLIVVSDMQFNPVPDAPWGYVPTKEDEMTNYEASKAMLAEVFPQEWVDDFKFVWWHVNGRTKDFPSNMDCGGCYNIGGFDGSIISMLLGGEVVTDPETGKRVMPTQEELIDKALHQEVLEMLTF
jgi:hypothetical protein